MQFINPNTRNVSNHIKQSLKSVQDFADSYEINEEHSIVQSSRANINKTALMPMLVQNKSNSPEQRFNRSNMVITIEQASIIDMQSKLRASRETVLNEKNASRLLKSKCDTFQHEADSWKLAHKTLTKEYNDWKEQSEIEIEDIRNYLKKEKANSTELKKILSLLKDDNLNLMNASQEYQSKIRQLSDTNATLKAERDDFSNRKSDLEESIRNREEEISALYHQNNLRAIKITELTEKANEKEKERKNSQIEVLLLGKRDHSRLHYGMC